MAKIFWASMCALSPRFSADLVPEVDTGCCGDGAARPAAEIHDVFPSLWCGAPALHGWATGRHAVHSKEVRVSKCHDTMD